MAYDPVKIQMRWIRHLYGVVPWEWETIDRKTDTHLVHPLLQRSGNCYLIRFYGEKHDKAKVAYLGDWGLFRFYDKKYYFDKDKIKELLGGPEAKNHDCREELRAHLQKQMKELEEV